MRLLGKSAIVLGLAGAMAIGSMTASEARNGRFIAGAAGVAIGAAAANANAAYYGPGYGYGYDRAGSAYTGDPSYAYGSGYGYSNGYYPSDSSYGYNTNTTSPQRERVLTGRDY